MYISNYCNYYFISIHAPAKGATRHTHASILLAAFQSTLPRRERHFLSRSRCASSRISIHAPAKGATSPAGFICVDRGFQSTLPRRERRKGLCCLQQGCDFNPRSREGSDLYDTTALPDAKISIHAPAKGATLSTQGIENGIQFQSTLPRRERHYFAAVRSWLLHFNPRSREGSDSIY